MTHFHVGRNMPGYMPDEGPYCTDGAEHALTVWREDIRRHIEALEDDEAFLEADTRQNTTTVADVADGVSQDVENERYWIEPMDGSVQDCELWPHNQ